MGALALLAWSVHAGFRDGAGALSFVPSAIGSALLGVLALSFRRGPRVPEPSGIDPRLSLLADKGPAMLWIDRLEGRERVNAVHSRVVGVDPGRLVGTAGKQHVTPEDLDE